MARAAVPVTRSDGTIAWQSYSWGELLDALRRDFQPNPSTDLQAFVMPAWVAPTMLNAWVSTNVAFVKDALSVVHFRGVLSVGASATAAFQLPVGYRPGITDFYAALQGSGIAGSYINIATNGNVVPTYTSGALYLNGISFVAEL